MIKLYKDCIVLEFDYRPEPGEDNYEVVDSLSSFLGEEIIFAETITLLDLMNNIRKDTDFFQKVFNVQLGGFDINLYLDDINKPIVEEKDDFKIDRLEIMRVASLHSYKKHNWFEYYLDFSGVASDGNADIGVKPGEEFGVAIEFTPLYKLRDLPVILNEKIDIRDDRKISGKKTVSSYEELIIFSGEDKFTVYDVFHAILNEISFCGAPEDRDDKREELHQNIQELDYLRENDPEGYEKTMIPWEEVKKELEDIIDDDEEESE